MFYPQTKKNLTICIIILMLLMSVLMYPHIKSIKQKQVTVNQQVAEQTEQYPEKVMNNIDIILPEIDISKSHLNLQRKNKEEQGNLSFLKASNIDLSGSLSDQLNTVADLGRQLNQNQLEHLYTYLENAPEIIEIKERKGMHVLINNIMTKLCEQTTPPHRLTEVLVSIALQEKHDNVVRDYAMQHLEVWYQKVSDKEEKIIICNTLFEGVNHGVDSLPGTCLLALQRLSKSDQNFDKTKIGPAAINLIKSKKTTSKSKLTALSICGEIKHKETVPIALEIIRNSKDDMLRIAAINVVKLKPIPEVVKTLQDLTAQTPAYVSRAAKHALKHIANSNTGNTNLYIKRSGV